MTGIAQTNIQLYEQLRAQGYGDEALIAAAAAYRFVQPLFSARFRGSGRPFLCHLVGTASILARDRAPIHEVLAGLLHAVYDAGLFSVDMHRKATPRKRAAVCAAAGERVEALVLAYQQLPWNRETIERLARAPSLQGDELAVLRLRLANELDDLADQGLRYAGAGKGQLVEEAGARERLSALAGRCGMPQLKDALDNALCRQGETAGESPVPGALKGPAYAYTRLPPTARDRLRFRIAFLLRRLRRRLGLPVD